MILNSANCMNAVIDMMHIRIHAKMVWIFEGILATIVTHCSHLVTKAGGSYNKVRKLDRGLKFKSLKDASDKDIANIKRHYKTSKRKAEKEPIETVRQVTELYNKDSISWQLPYENLTRIARDHHGNYHRVLIRVIKVALKKAFETFQNEKTQTSKLVEHLKIYDLSMLESGVTPSVCSVAARIATIWITFRM